MGGRLHAIHAVLLSRVLRRIELAFVAFNIAEWATWLAMIVYAFDRGGAAEAGLVAFVQLAPSVVTAPAAAVIGDRFPRARILTLSYILQALTMAATAVALSADVPLLAYLFGTLTATSITLTRPLQGALLPEVVETPEELTAANVVSGVGESVGMLVGPLLTSLTVAVDGPRLAFAVSSVIAVVAAILVGGLHRSTSVASTEPAAAELSNDAASIAADVGSGLSAGLTTTIRDPRLRSLVVILAVVLGLVGALDVFFAVMAHELFAVGDGAVGVFAAAVGLGALVGSAGAVVLVGRDHLTWPLIASAAVFGGGVALIAGVSSGAAALVLLIIAGIGSAIVRVAIATLTQRVAGDDVMTRVFGIEEAVMMGAQATGALAVPILIAAVGPRGALIVFGLAVPIVALAMSAPLLRVDRAGVHHLRELRVLRHVPMFVPLAAPVLERLAADARSETRATGDVIIAEGEPGEAFYVIERGAVEVSVAGERVGRRGGLGESFGEIALLRAVPRTATVVAAEPVSLIVVSRDQFLDALCGQGRSRAIADRTVDERLAIAGPGPLD
jgi:MFS family permease